GEEEEEHHHGDHDPHTWIDPLTAKEEARNIRDGLIAADPANATYYTSRADVLFARFDSLHTNYTSGLYGKQRDMIIVSHEAYRYLGHSYGFKVQGVIGLSADEDPNPQVYLDIIDMMEENDIYILYTNPVFSQDSVQTLKTNLEARVGGDVRILSLYTLTSPSNGLDYFAMQEANLEALKTGLMSA
ncbi:MAG: zinc ABC transporter substrate-binding protein, partial [Thermoplasmata archaeon]|nr:zinc ABC transporter substrate-binding protein [Thermoplasmata archaeon]